MSNILTTAPVSHPRHRRIIHGKGIDIEDLYFGITRIDFNASTFSHRNLFGSIRVLSAVASYVLMPLSKREERQLTPESDPEYPRHLLSWLFSDTWGRMEYEMICSEFPPASDPSRRCEAKLDTYFLYVLPNADYLLDLVSRVSKSSARRYDNEWGYGARRKQYKQLRAKAARAAQSTQEENEGSGL